MLVGTTVIADGADVNNATVGEAVTATLCVAPAASRTTTVAVPVLSAFSVNLVPLRLAVTTEVLLLDTVYPGVPPPTSYTSPVPTAKDTADAADTNSGVPGAGAGRHALVASGAARPRRSTRTADVCSHRTSGVWVA